MNAVSELLSDTIRLIQKNTWGRDAQVFNKPNCYCILTGLHYCLGLTYPIFLAPAMRKEPGRDRAIEIRNAAAALIYDLLPSDFRYHGEIEPVDHRRGIIRFNDAPGRTKAQVIQILAQAQALAEMAGE